LRKVTQSGSRCGAVKCFHVLLHSLIDGLDYIPTHQRGQQFIDIPLSYLCATNTLQKQT
jgi:hypothetical protein